MTSKKELYLKQTSNNILYMIAGLFGVNGVKLLLKEIYGMGVIYIAIAFTDMIIADKFSHERDKLIRLNEKNNFLSRKLN